MTRDLFVVLALVALAACGDVASDQPAEVFGADCVERVADWPVPTSAVTATPTTAVAITPATDEIPDPLAVLSRSIYEFRSQFGGTYGLAAAEMDHTAAQMVLYATAPCLDELSSVAAAMGIPHETRVALVSQAAEFEVAAVIETRSPFSASYHHRTEELVVGSAPGEYSADEVLERVSVMITDTGLSLPDGVQVRHEFWEVVPIEEP